MLTAAEVFKKHTGNSISQEEYTAMVEFACICCIEQVRLINQLDFEDLPENELANDFEENRALAIENAFDLDSIK